MRDGRKVTCWQVSVAERTGVGFGLPVVAGFSGDGESFLVPRSGLQRFVHVPSRRGPARSARAPAFRYHNTAAEEPSPTKGGLGLPRVWLTPDLYLTCGDSALLGRMSQYPSHNPRELRFDVVAVARQGGARFDSDRQGLRDLRGVLFELAEGCRSRGWQAPGVTA